MSIILNDNIDTRANKPTDNRFGPYASTAAAIAAIPSYQRYVGLTVGIGTTNVIEYWFKSGTGDLDLIQKSSAGNVENLTAGSGIAITGTATNPTIAVTTPTQLTTNISTDIPGDAASDAKYPSVKATKSYVDGLVVGLLNDRGNYPAPIASPGNYPSTGGSGGGGTILKGDIWFISSAGFLNMIPVAVGASVRALVNSPGILTDTDWDIIDTGLGFVPENSANRVLNASGIVANPTSTTNYVSVNALTDYLSTNPPSTPTLQQVLAITPTQTSTGYDINLVDGLGLETNLGLGDIAVNNTVSGASISMTSTIITLSDLSYSSTLSTTQLTFSDVTSGGTLTIDAPTITGTPIISFPNATGTVALSINNTYFPDATGNLSIPIITSSGTGYRLLKWDVAGTTVVDSQIYDNGTNIGIGTITPAYKLDVNGTFQCTTAIINGPLGLGPVPDYGTSGQYLKSNGVGVAPSWNTLPTIPTVSGTIARVARFTATNTLGDGVIRDNGSTKVSLFQDVSARSPVLVTPNVLRSLTLLESGTMRLPYERFAVEWNGDHKFGVYTTNNVVNAGVAYALGNSAYLNADGRYPGFEYQFVTQSTGTTTKTRFNYLERDATIGTVAGSVDGIFTMFGNGSVELNPVSSSVSFSLDPKLVIGAAVSVPAVGVKLYVNGNSKVVGTSITDVLRLTPSGSAPGSPSTGDIYYDTVSGLQVWNGSAWKTIALVP
jgi:hypothetical protein